MFDEREGGGKGISWLAILSIAALIIWGIVGMGLLTHRISNLALLSQPETKIPISTLSSSSTSINTTSSTTSTSTTSIGITIYVTITTIATTTLPTTIPANTADGIEVSAHRMRAPYWAPCFAEICFSESGANETGPGASMFFTLYDSSMKEIQMAQVDEKGYVFTGLSPGIYYVYPADCDECHGSTHDVIFDHWNDGNATKLRRVELGSSISAWYSCTNGCGGI